MLGVLFLFSGIFFFKSMIFSIIYSNYLMYLYYPLEIASLSLINSNNTLDYDLSHYNTYLRWSITNWIGIEEDYSILDEIENNSSNYYIIILCWLVTFLFYQIYYLIDLKIHKKNNLTKISWINYNLKYLLINYFSFFLWNLLILFDLNDMNFWISLVNVLIFNFISFWIPGLIFYYIYGDKLYFYRNELSFLIDNYNLKYKYFTINLLGMKLISGFYILLNQYYTIESKFLLFLFNIIYFYIFSKKTIFRERGVEFKILPIISSIIIILSILENYFPISIEFFISKTLLVFVYLGIMINFYKKFHKKILNENQNEFEMEEVENIIV